MRIPWIESVKSTGKLTFYNGIAVGKWSTVFTATLNSFNKLKLGVKAVQAKDKDAANVVLQLSEGIASFKYDGKDYNEAFDANKFHGYTMLLHRDGVMEKAAIFLPSDPKIMAGYNDRGDTLYEKVNPHQMRVIAVHELIHACGLDNDEHDDDGVFQKNLIPVGDKVGSVMAKRGSKPMPPIYISDPTRGKIRQNWS